MKETFEMVAKTMQGLEEVLAEELRSIGASNVQPGCRMVSFEGDLEMLYRANLSCRTALRILKPIYRFKASDTDTLYEMAKEFDWSTVLSADKTFCIDTVANSDEFTHSQFVTYRIKDAIVDWFRDRLGENRRPGVRLQDADVMFNVHISGEDVTISLDSSGESLHKRGWRVAQTEAPINEVLAAGIILRSGWRGEVPFVDPMCGSGTFLVEAAMIAANINPGIYRKGFAFETWPDFDPELLDRLYNDDSQEREVTVPILGADISPKAVKIAQENLKSAGVSKYVKLECKPLSKWEEVPEGGVLVTNPPYGERISVEDMEGLYSMIGEKLKKVFTGYHAWIIGLHKEHFDAIHLSASTKIELYNGSLPCELREYIIFEGNYKDFRAQGNRIHFGDEQPEASRERVPRKPAGRRDDDNHKHPGNDRKRRGGEEFPARRDRRFTSDNFARENKEFSKKFDHENRRSTDRFAREDRKFNSNVDRYSTGTDSNNPENPLSVRRNPHALKSITGKQPSLSKGPNVVMRSRKGNQDNN